MSADEHMATTTTVETSVGALAAGARALALSQRAKNKGIGEKLG